MGQSFPIKVPLYDADGIIIPSRMGSYLVWLQLQHGEIKPEPIGEDGLCAICHGYEIIETEQYGRIWCLCHINAQTKRLKNLSAKYESALRPRSLEELQPISGTIDQLRNFWAVVEAVRVFCVSPTEWLALMGSPGVGKTHMLSAIKKYFGAWAMYITASDFETLVFQSLKDDQLNDLIEHIKRVPILLFDDLGSEYVRDGKDFVRSNLRKIIDYRYKLPMEYPTVIATNLSPAALKAYDPRIMDRLLDQEITSYAEMLFPSWRTRGVIDANVK